MEFNHSQCCISNNLSFCPYKALIYQLNFFGSVIAILSIVSTYHYQDKSFNEYLCLKKRYPDKSNLISFQGELYENLGGDKLAEIISAHFNLLCQTG